MPTSHSFSVNSAKSGWFTLRSKTTKGFTLIELLVVIAIIAILSTMALVVYTSVLMQGRDSKRQSDLRAIQSALEQYYADQFFYPSGITSGGEIAFGAKKYLNIVPKDPTDGGNYMYRYVPSPSGCTDQCTSYCIYARLENSNPGTGSICTDTYNSPNFAVSPP